MMALVVIQADRRPVAVVSENLAREIWSAPIGSLGAEPGAVRRMVMRQGLVLAGIGVAIGLAAASGLTQLMKSLL